MRDQRKNMKNPPIEMRFYKDQIDVINRHLASTLRKLPRVVDVIARLSVVIALYELENIPCEIMDVNSAVSDHHDENLSNDIALNMHRLIEEEVDAMTISSDELLDALITSELEEIGTPEHKQRFKGHLVAR